MGLIPSNKTLLTLAVLAMPISVYKWYKVFSSDDSSPPALEQTTPKKPADISNLKGPGTFKLTYSGDIHLLNNTLTNNNSTSLRTITSDGKLEITFTLEQDNPETIHNRYTRLAKVTLENAEKITPTTPFNALVPPLNLQNQPSLQLPLDQIPKYNPAIIETIRTHASLLHPGEEYTGFCVNITDPNNPISLMKLNYKVPLNSDDKTVPQYDKPLMVASTIKLFVAAAYCASHTFEEIGENHENLTNMLHNSNNTCTNKMMYYIARKIDPKIFLTKEQINKGNIPPEIAKQIASLVQLKCNEIGCPVHEIELIPNSGRTKSKATPNQLFNLMIKLNQGNIPYSDVIKNICSNNASRVGRGPSPKSHQPGTTQFDKVINKTGITALACSDLAIIKYGAKTYIIFGCINYPTDRYTTNAQTFAFQTRGNGLFRSITQQMFSDGIFSKKQK